MTTSADFDVIELLRSERPDAATDPMLGAGCMPSTRRFAQRDSTALRRRTRIRMAVVGAIAAAAILTGVQLVGSAHRGAPAIRGITAAEAKQMAVTALRRVGTLTDYRMIETWSATEVGGEHRVVSRRTDATVIDGNRSSSNNNRNDFVDQDVDGAEFRTVAGRTYVESATPVVKQRWMLALGGGGGSIGGYSTQPPETAGIIAQLQREGLVSARRTVDGSVVVEVRRPASELADVDGMDTGPGDPITGFATSIARSGYPRTIVTARLAMSVNGDMRDIRVSAMYPGRLPDGHGGAKVMAEFVNEWKLRPATGAVKAPDPRDVMVVGDILQTRHGVTGLAGPQSTLDSYTPATLLALKAKMQANAREMSGYYMRRTTRPPRHYSKLMRFISQRRRLLRAELATMQRDPAALAANDRCRPYWPTSGRAMDSGRAKANPAAAGWRCHLTTVDAYVSTEPKSSGWLWEFIGGGGDGCCLTDEQVAKWAK